MTGCIAAGLGVAFGAFGAHALKGMISDDNLNIFEIAVRYQMCHALALLATAWASTQWSYAGVRQFKTAGWCFAIGIILFSGSLYTLACTDQRWLGAITPFGGLAFLAGWVLLVWTVVRKTKTFPTK